MSTETTDFTTWPIARLREQQEHLQRILPVLNERDDPEKPQIRAELIAIREEIDRRASEGETS